MTLSPCTIQYLKQAKAFLLTNPEFKYETLVSKYDYEKDCGTCCCLLGWSPAFSPHFKWDSGYSWTVKDRDDTYITITQELQSLFYHHHRKLGIKMKQVTAHHILEEIGRLLFRPTSPPPSVESAGI